MIGTEGQDPAFFEAGSAGFALDGRESGDCCVIAPFPRGVLVGAIDGLGHGPEAAAAAQAAVRLVTAHAGEPVTAVVEQCHEGLRRTRGVAMSLASLDRQEPSMTWIGVGNVEGTLLRRNRAAHRSREAILLRGGVVGYRLPDLRATAIPLEPGDLLIMATDGIYNDFVPDVTEGRSAQEVAEGILAECSKGSDDALVVAVRFLGSRP
jgi:hypothetical protein